MCLFYENLSLGFYLFLTVFAGRGGTKDDGERKGSCTGKRVSRARYYGRRCQRRQSGMPDFHTRGSSCLPNYRSEILVSTHVSKIYLRTAFIKCAFVFALSKKICVFG